MDERTCKWDGCNKDWVGQGYCVNHYQQARRLGIVEKLPRAHVITDVDPEAMTATCSDCGPDAPILKQRHSYTCRTRARAAGAARREANRDRLRAYHREYNRAYRFGWTVAEMHAVLASHPNCEICGTALTKRTARLDHDHSCCERGKGCRNCFRGVLCGNCNSAIGLLKEDPDRFASALSYLARTSVPA